MKIIKKRTCIILLAVLVLSIIFIFGLYKCSLSYMSADKFEKCYMNNKERFDEVADELTKKVKDIDVDYYGRLEQISYEKFRKKKENNYLYINENMIVYPNKNANLNYNELKYFNMYFNLYEVRRLINTSDLQYIDIHKDYLLFVSKEFSDFKACLLYSENGVPDTKYLYSIEHIDGNWYYCLSK